MKKILLLLTIFNIFSTDISAQFGMGGGGGGFPGMGGGTRKDREQTAIPGTAQAQSKGSAKISGYVVDSTVSKAVEYASVALMVKATKKPVDGAICDDKGKFSITRVATGEYILSISFMGYKNEFELTKFGRSNRGRTTLID
jgi:CarboxypepD_reg-like domain